MSLIILSVDDASTPAVDPLTPGSEAWARELCAQQFLTAWPVESALVIVDGLPLAVPAYLEGETQPSANRFAVCSFQPTTSKQATQGQHALIEYRGYAWIKIWTPATDEGRLVASKLADAARRVYTRKQLSSSPYIAPLQLETGGVTQTAIDGRWYMQAIATPLRWYEQQ